MMLTLSFGSDKFGMPWTATGQNLKLFEVAAWFPEDVANFGGIFAIAPVFFAWMGAFSEVVGGLFLALGLQTRLASFLIMCTMLVAIFFQKWGQGMWGMLPAMGFLWVSIYNLYLGSGRFGLDYLIAKNIKLFNHLNRKL
ncbi:DoxX family protein [Maribacter halichondriae]|uniref:DoxX family protein n=1 Tax=Maribacter halichondriae TaxID=2980554 RepID=UPI0023582342|nr:DoxX family protein [Maribacter sp. Hal144]